MKTAILTTIVLLFLTAPLFAQDWPSRNRGRDHNAAIDVDKEPGEFKIGSGKEDSSGIKWSVNIGHGFESEPAIANGLVWIGGNNDSPRDPTLIDDAGVLFCFRESDGKFLYQHVSPRRTEGREYDWPGYGITSTPFIEKDRLYFCTNRCEIVCLDIKALNDGMGAVHEVWKVDMVDTFGVRPGVAHIGSRHLHCSPVVWGDYVYVNTTHTVRSYQQPNETANGRPAPSLICFNRHTGAVVWSDNSPGDYVLGQQWNNPTVIHAGGRDQVIMGQGDGWVRSFDCQTGALIWKFDMNFKYERLEHGEAWGDDRILRQAIAEPVFHNDRLFLVAGTEFEFGSATGRLCCIDPSKTGDISADHFGESKVINDNPNSGLVWEFAGSKTGRFGHDADMDNPNVMHSSFGSVAIKNGLVVAVDFNGSVHCLDEKSGQRYWTFNTHSRLLGSPLILGKQIIVGDEDCLLHSIPLDKQLDKNQCKTYESNSFHHTAPVYANDTLYISSLKKLYAIPCKDLEQK
jgi:outer membrane protein assembly factor BamB